MIVKTKRELWQEWLNEHLASWLRTEDVRLVFVDELKKWVDEQRRIIKRLEKSEELSYNQADACLGQLLLLEEEVWKVDIK